MGQLQAVVREIHAVGIVHGDLESRNIKVTPDNTVYILDFEKASLESASFQHTDELHHEQARLSYIASVVNKKVSKICPHVACQGNALSRHLRTHL